MGKIHDAAKAGKVAKVQSILLWGKCGLNDRNRKNRTALHLACSSGHPEVVTLLVDRKCDIDACDNKKRTALIMAIQCQQEECVTILLEHGADPNVEDASGFTPLHHAAFRNNIPITAKLLSHNADIEAENKDGLTPISFALKHKKQEVAAFLTEKKKTIHATEQESNRQIIFEDEDKSKTYSQNRNPAQQMTPEKRQKKLDRRENVHSLNMSERLQQNCDDYFSEEENQREKYIVNGNVGEFSEEYSSLKPTTEMSSSSNKAVGKKDAQTFVSESDLEVTSDQQKNLGNSESIELLVEKEMKQPRRNVTKVSENVCDGASPEEDKEDDGDGVCQQRRRGKADFQQFPIVRNKVPKEKMSTEKKKVSISNKKANDLLHKSHMLQDEITMLRPEIKTVKNRMKSKKLCLECIETVEEKINEFQKTIKLKEETIHQLTAEITMLNFKLENERKFSGLENELNHMRDDIGRNTLVLEHIQRDLRQIQCQMKKTEYADQNEQRKASKHVGKKESVGERSSQLQSENIFLQQLNEVGNKEKTVFNMQDQFHDVTENFQHHTKTQAFMPKEKNERDNQSDPLQERLHQYNYMKEERELCEHKNQYQKLQLENSTLKVKVKNLSEKIEQLQKKPLRENMEFVCMKMIQKLKEDKKELEQEVTKLKSHMKKNIEGQVEKYKQELEEHFNSELQTLLKQVNLFLQKEAEHQDHLFELRETNTAAQRNELELRIKDLESEVSQSRTQNNSTKIELEKFKQLYLEEYELRKSLSNEVNDLHRTIEMLEETNNRLLVIQQNSTGNSRPIGQHPHERNLHSNMGLNRSFMPRETPTSHPQSSHKTLKRYLTGFQQKLQNVDTEINGAIAELPHGLFRSARPSRTNKSSRNLQRRIHWKTHRF